MKYGCIGEHLGHSFSREIHALLGNTAYELVELPPETVGDFLKKRDFLGINVTIPYKQKVMPYLDEIDAAARAIGAVNTVVNRGGRLIGCNTDFGGMQALLAHAGVSLAGKKVLILGTGGTSRTALAVAKAAGARETVRVSRRAGEGSVTYEQALEEHTDAQVILNTTPCGMYPQIAETPIDVSRFPRLCGVIDAIYNPLRSRLVSAARARGIPAEGGLYMLAAQGVLAAERFFDTVYPVGVTERVWRTLNAQKENIVLTGMPASGKTSVGREIAAMTGRVFKDTDEEITRTHGMPIPEIFQRCGEAQFRAWERETIAELAAMGGAVIATGGGAILSEENVTALKQNGRLYFLDRDPALLAATADRPLSSTREAVFARYRERIERYRATADVIVAGNGTVDEVANAVKEAHNT